MPAAVDLLMGASGRDERASAPDSSTEPGRVRPETITPGERARVPPLRRVSAYALAIALPPIVAFALLPLRTDHSEVVALAMVVPVIVVAVLGAVGPAVVAALSASLAYNIVYTEPYWRPAIDDVDDIATTVALGATAVIVGVLCSRIVQLTARAASRRDELHHLLSFARTVSGDDELQIGVLAEQVCVHLKELLGLRGCDWEAGQHDSPGPILLSDGTIMGHLTALNPDRAKLPEHLEMPVVAGTTQFGRFLLVPDSRRIVSAEERMTAATIVRLFAREANGRTERTGTSTRKLPEP